MSEFTTSVLVENNPFPGLRPFKIEESHLFFGREGQSDEVLLKLSRNRFVGVIGPSGSGKSSFIYCGVMPILYGGFLTDASPNWEVVVTRPGAGPIDNLSESILKTIPDYLDANPEEQRIKRTIFSTLLRSSSLGLVEAIEQTRKNADVNYLILVDQFEELFRFKDSLDANSVNETLAFVNLLMEAIDYPDAPIYVAITMRSDFIGDCAQFPELTRKINDSHYLIPQLTRDQKRRAIEGPMAVGGATISPRLVQQLLNDLGDNPDQLPILQHALMRTWSYWAQYKDFEGEDVDLKHYEAIGTMREALSLHANEAYDELNEEQKRICEILFKAITEKRGENFGIRRPTRLNEIASIADVSESEVSGIIEKFREQGRSLLTPAYGIPIRSKSMIDISHESLMRIWVRLKNWVDDEAEAVQMYTRLAEAASMHQVGKAGLWRPPDLQLALNWQAKHKPTLVWGQRYHPAYERTLIFLEYSKKQWETEQRIKEQEQKKKLQRARFFALFLGGATLVCLGFLVFAIYQMNQAELKSKEAKINLDIALENEKKAIAAQKVAIAARDSAKIAQSIAESERLKATAAKDFAELKRMEAIRNLSRAELAEKEANANAIQANKNADLAKTEADRANKNAQDALYRRYLSIAKSMAVKSKELTNDKEQQALIAQQAYVFNTTYKGYEYDNDIYNGLYFALKNNNDPLTQSLEAHTKGAARVLLTHKSSGTIFSGGSDGKIFAWTKSGALWQKAIIADRTDIQYYSLDITSDGSQLIAGGWNNLNEKENYVEVYNLKNASEKPKRIPGFIYAIDNLQFIPDGSGFFARDNSGKAIRYSDLKTVKEVIKPTVKINSLDLSPDGKTLAGAGDDGNLYLWDATTFAERKISIPGSRLMSVTFAPESRRIVVGDNRGLIRLYDNLAGTLIRTLPGHTAEVETIRFNHAGNFMATASKDRTVRLWNMNVLKEQPIVLQDHSDWVWSAAFSPNDDQLFASVHSAVQNLTSVDHTIRAWPTKIETMANLLCPKLKRPMTKEEWDIYVADDLDQTATCANLPLTNDK